MKKNYVFVTLYFAIKNLVVKWNANLTNIVIQRGTNEAENSDF